MLKLFSKYLVILTVHFKSEIVKIWVDALCVLALLKWRSGEYLALSYQYVKVFVFLCLFFLLDQLIYTTFISLNVIDILVNFGKRAEHHSEHRFYLSLFVFSKTKYPSLVCLMHQLKVYCINIYRDESPICCRGWVEKQMLLVGVWDLAV